MSVKGQVREGEADRVLLAFERLDDPIMAAYDREQAWKLRGEYAIRAEMERALARRGIARCG